MARINKCKKTESILSKITFNKLQVQQILLNKWSNKYKINKHMICSKLLNKLTKFQKYKILVWILVKKKPKATVFLIITCLYIIVLVRLLRFKLTICYKQFPNKPMIMLVLWILRIYLHKWVQQRI